MILIRRYYIFGLHILNILQILHILQFLHIPHYLHILHTLNILHNQNPIVISFPKAYNNIGLSVVLVFVFVFDFVFVFLSDPSLIIEYACHSLTDSLTH